MPAASRVSASGTCEGWQSVVVIVALESSSYFVIKFTKISFNTTQTWNFLLMCLQDVALAGVIRTVSGAGAAVPALPQRHVSGAGTEKADASSTGWCHWCVCECWSSLETVRLGAWVSWLLTLYDRTLFVFYEGFSRRRKTSSSLFLYSEWFSGVLYTCFFYHVIFIVGFIFSVNLIFTTKNSKNHIF